MNRINGQFDCFDEVHSILVWFASQATTETRRKFAGTQSREDFLAGRFYLIEAAAALRL